MDFILYKVVNEDTPHCLKCSTSYYTDKLPQVPSDRVCRKVFGKSKEAYVCEGQIVDDTYFDWSLNLLKDYSVMNFGSLRLYNEIYGKIEERLEAAKTGKSRETGRSKVNVQAEIENAMRLKGINILSKVGPDGELLSKSMYKLPIGVSTVSEFAYEELAPRFEQKVPQDADEDATPEGFLIFTVAEEEPKPEKPKEEVKETPTPNEPKEEITDADVGLTDIPEPILEKYKNKTLNELRTLGKEAGLDMSKSKTKDILAWKLAELEANPAK